MSQMQSLHDDEEHPLVKNQDQTNNLQAPAHDAQERHSYSGSERYSTMGESVLYEDHLDELAMQERNENLAGMRMEISIYALAFIGSLAVTLLANGLFIQPSVSVNGCWIGLDKWMYALCFLLLVKLAIQFARLLSYKRHNQESIMIHIGGNYVLMPILTLVFFGFNVWMKQQPYPQNSNVRGSHYTNICETEDTFSYGVFLAFQAVYWGTYIPVCYYIVTTFMLLQTMCLIRAMVQRRINMMRERDEPNNQEQRGDDDEEEGLFETIFGSILQMPLPVPEILSSLEKDTYGSMQKAAKTACKDKLWKQCPICWSDFKRKEMVTSLICNEKHIFHTQCIEEWIRKGHNSCPLCRQPIANI